MAVMTLTAPVSRPRPVRATSRRTPAPRASAARPVVHASAAPVRATSRRTPVRLTRRGRLVLVLLVAVLAFVALSLGRGAAPQATTTPAAGPVATAIVVQPGDTLWQIARDLDPAADPRATMARLRELNGLSGDTLAAGQALLVPAHG